MRARSYLILVLAAASAPLWAQFSSGSTGSDGALNLTAPGTVTLDPNTLPHSCANNVCNFTSINIGANTTVVLTSQLWRNASVVWLSQGDVTVSGAIKADGNAGATMNQSNPGLVRFPAAPGPGGFPGGVGGYLGQPAQPGAGFGGGAAGSAGSAGQQGIYSYYNLQLTPLVGGSGGGGGDQGTGLAGGNGGGGGGALRIVSATSITVDGAITSLGGATGFPLGNAAFAGVGSGGVIHLIAPSVGGAGTLNTHTGSSGVTEISSSNNTFPSPHVSGTYVAAGLYAPPLPSGTPSVQVTSVNGVNAPAHPAADPMVPDVTINSGTPVSVAISAQNIPLNTTVTLYLTSENGPDSKITCGTLSGTIASSTATCTGVNFPSGVTITNILAVW